MKEKTPEGLPVVSEETAEKYFKRINRWYTEGGSTFHAVVKNLREVLDDIRIANIYLVHPIDDLFNRFTDREAGKPFAEKRDAVYIPWLSGYELLKMEDESSIPIVSERVSRELLEEFHRNAQTRTNYIFGKELLIRMETDNLVLSKVIEHTTNVFTPIQNPNEINFGAYMSMNFSIFFYEVLRRQAEIDNK